MIPELSLYTTIIDKTVIWYGAINALGYASEEDHMIKVSDNHLANELIDILHKQNSVMTTGKDKLPK